MDTTNGVGILTATLGGSVQIGGPGSGDGSVVSGNAGDEIEVIEYTTATLQGNVIGGAAGGSGPLPKGGFGVDVQSSGLVLGGAWTADGVASEDPVSAFKCGVVIAPGTVFNSSLSTSYSNVELSLIPTVNGP
jgi:hypothetical protein